MLSNQKMFKKLENNIFSRGFFGVDFWEIKNFFFSIFQVQSMCSSTVTQTALSYLHDRLDFKQWFLPLWLCKNLQIFLFWYVTEQRCCKVIQKNSTSLVSHFAKATLPETKFILSCMVEDFRLKNYTLHFTWLVKILSGDSYCLNLF